MSCCNGFDGFNRFDGFDGRRGCGPFEHRDRLVRFSGDGYCRTEFPRKRCREEGCHIPVKRITCIEPSCSCLDPTVLRVTGLWNEIGTKPGCFKLVLCADTLENSNVSPVELVDDDGQVFVLMQGFSGNVVRYDQLTQLVDFHRKDGWRKCHNGQVVLNCRMQNDGPVGHELHIVCNSPLPHSTHVPNLRMGTPLRNEAVI